ncbi:MAG TPA: SDR family NAD(P)-dependent oxidoreductase [Acidimicrobiales bacterium]|nr:SDR family NAD(P)-dependent oxidoreductase [Acidimicrobiales bacterium]
MSADPEGTTLDGKIAIVTGAARGLGFAIAEQLTMAGAAVVVADIDEAGAHAAADKLAGAEAVRCDVRDEDRVAELIAATVDRRGRLDIMVCNAGVGTVKPLVEMPLAEWREVLGVDLDGVFLCTKHAGRAMAAQGGGCILTISSIKAFGGSPAIGHYGAAKAGVVSLTKTAALELRAHGVRVNAICPGWVATDMVSDHRDDLESVLGVDFSGYIDHLQGRLGEPEEVARLAVFLASDRARFSSGAAYIVDGGATASLV